MRDIYEAAEKAPKQRELKKAEREAKRKSRSANDRSSIIDKMWNAPKQLAGKMATVPAGAIAGGYKATAALGSFPVRGIVAIVSAYTGSMFTKEGFKKFSEGIKKVGKFANMAYAYSTGPEEVRKQAKALWRHMPWVRLRIVNYWALVYRDLENIEEVNIVYYSPNGTVLVNTTSNAEDLYKKAADKERETETEEPAEGGKKSSVKKPEGGVAGAAPEPANDSLDVPSTLNMLQEEVLEEVLGLPPIGALVARWKQYGQVKEYVRKEKEKLAEKDPDTGKIKEPIKFSRDEMNKKYGKFLPLLVRHRVWLFQIWDTARDKTYIFAFDEVHEEQPFDKMSYEGRTQMI